MNTKPDDRVPALCCVCGTRRDVSPRGARGGVPRGESPEEIQRGLEGLASHRAYWQRRAEAVPYERMTCKLKCATCGAQTKHAVVRDKSLRDFNEAENYRPDSPWTFFERTELERSLDDFRALGVRVVEDDEVANRCTLRQYLDDRQWLLEVGPSVDLETLREARAALLDHARTRWFVRQGSDDEVPWRGVSWMSRA